MTAIPGSHYLIEKAIAEPKFRAEKEKDNVYTAGNNLEELDWNPEEIVLKAGGVFFYEGQVIHSASDNMTQQPRLVCLYNFTQKGDREKEVKCSSDHS